MPRAAVVSSSSPVALAAETFATVTVSGVVTLPPGCTLVPYAGDPEGRIQLPDGSVVTPYICFEHRRSAADEDEGSARDLTSDEAAEMGLMWNEWLRGSVAVAD